MEYFSKSFSFLKPEDLISLCSVSKQFARLWSYSGLWKEYCMGGISGIFFRRKKQRNWKMMYREYSVISRRKLLMELKVGFTNEQLSEVHCSPPRSLKFTIECSNISPSLFKLIKISRPWKSNHPNLDYTWEICARTYHSNRYYRRTYKLIITRVEKKT